MGFVKNIAAGMAVCLLCGCASSREPAAEITHQQGVKENNGKMAEGMNGNGFPYLGGNWSTPLVQNVLIPAHVQGGVFYPEHNELVIITPGEWKKAGVFPLHSDVQPDSDGAEALSTNITALPGITGNLR